MNHTTCSCPKWWQATNGPLIALLSLGWLGFGGWWYTCKIRYMCEAKAVSAVTAPAETTTKTEESTVPATDSSTPVSVDTKTTEAVTAPAEITTTAPVAAPALVKVFFAPDSSSLQLDTKEQASVDTIVSYLKSNTKATATITGFTTSLGATTADEVAVGQARANSVKTYLVAQGIASERITTESKGANGVDDSGNPVDQSTNRRAEIVVNANN